MGSSKVNRPTNIAERLNLSMPGIGYQGRLSDEMRAEEQEIGDRLVRTAELMIAGKPPDDPVVLDQIDWYYRSASRYISLDAAMFTSMGRFLIESQRIRTFFEDVAEGSADYVRDAIAAYAKARLGMSGA
jgi:hypothetical protein